MQKPSKVTIATLAVTVIIVLSIAMSPLHAALSTSYQFNGKGNWSIDATGSNNTPVGVIATENIPAGSTVVQAFLYSSLYVCGVAPSVTFDGVALGPAPLSLGCNAPKPGIALEAWRYDVTAQVAAKVGAGGASYSFDVDAEVPNSQIDGEVLVIVYSNLAEVDRSIFILDGFSASAGDQTTVNYASPLPDPTTAGFEALMSLGIGFGAQPGGQVSLVDINGRRLTSSAGGADDGLVANGALITAGGVGDSTANLPDPFLTPSPANDYDDELYDLAQGDGVNPAPYLSTGETMTVIDTINPSNDDNIFFLGINITARATIDAPIDITKAYRHTNTCFERDNDGDGMISEDPMEFGDDGVPLLIDNDDDGLVDEDPSECPDGTNPGDVIDNDGEDMYFVDSVVKKNGKVSSYNPGQVYAVVTVNVLADIEDLHIGEFYDDCTMDPPDLLDLNPINGGGRAKVVVEHDNGTLEQLFDANTDDPNVVFDSDEDATVVWWMGSFAAGDIYHLYVKFGPGKNSTGDGSCVNNAEAATPMEDEDEFFTVPAEATLVVMPKEN